MSEPGRARVLLVDDRPSVLKVLAAVLEPSYAVSTAGDGGAALALLGAGAFEVVLTDVRMPGLSGFEVLRAVRDRSPGSSVVLMTAFANIPDAVAAIKLGAYDYVAKPVEADELLLVVARALEYQRDPGADAGEEPLGGVVAAGGGPGGPDISVGFRSAIGAARDAASRRYLVNLMRTYQGNVTHAAVRAGMTRESLHRLLKKFDVRSEQYKDRQNVH